MPIDADEQRRRNAEYARRSRAKKAAARDERRAIERESAARAADASGRVTMRLSVEQSVEAMRWIRPSDQAAIDLALLTADQIDVMRLAAEPSVARLTQLGQLLLRVLHDLGGTPTVRLQYELRSLRLTGATSGSAPTVEPTEIQGVPDDDDVAVNVTSISRPPKRGRAG